MEAVRAALREAFKILPHDRNVGIAERAQEDRTGTSAFLKHL